jgi:hypothetical protein
MRRASPKSRVAWCLSSQLRPIRILRARPVGNVHEHRWLVRQLESQGVTRPHRRGVMCCPWLKADRRPPTVAPGALPLRGAFRHLDELVDDGLDLRRRQSILHWCFLFELLQDALRDRDGIFLVILAVVPGHFDVKVVVRAVCVRSNDHREIHIAL